MNHRLSAALILRLSLTTFLVLTGLWARAEGISEFKLESDSFLSPSYSATSQSSFELVGGHFKSDPTVPSYFVIDADGAYAFGAPLLTYTNIREAAVQFHPTDNQTITFGRKLERWSELDRRWNFGLIEPVFGRDPLSPESQGLTGLFWQLENDGYRVNLFGSMVYLPSQGPSYGIDSNGQFENESPWFAHPPDSVRLLSETSLIKYQINTPPTEDVVFRPSYGARLDLGEKGPFRARIAALYLPMNQLALPFSAIIDIPADRADVTIDPQVVYHTVTSGDLAYVGDSVAYGLSVAQDSPGQVANPNPTETTPLYTPAILLSPWLDLPLTKGWKLSLQHLQISGGELGAVGPDASAQRLSVTTRYPYREANEVTLEGDTRLLWGHRLTMKTSYMQSTLNQFQFFTAQGRVQINRHWSLRSELQLVKAEDLTTANQNTIADNINNDQFIVGVGYAF